MFAVCTAAVSFLSFAVAVAAEPDTRPTVYLTFDDGPSSDSVTTDILELLARYDAKATFFVTGQRARKVPSRIPEILYAGHAIGNHTDSHVHLVDSSSIEIVKELKAAGKAVTDAGGPQLTCFRPPFGATDNRVNSIALELGMVAIGWSADTRDWDSLIQTTAIYDILDRSSDGSIVLMHDGPTHRGKTLQALSDWMAVAAHRYQFQALPACLPYGASSQFAANDDQEPDSLLEKETLETLLAKIRSYRFSLQSETASVSPALIEPHKSVTARLDEKWRERAVEVQ